MTSLRDFVQNNKKFIVAHRGASGTQIENTIPAFEVAVEQGAKVIEVDIQVSMDKVPFAYHDKNLKKINMDQDASKLSSYEMTSINLNPDPEQDKIHIPTLEEILRFCKQNEIYLIIEIKVNKEGKTDPENIDVIIDTVKSFDYTDNCLFASFDVDTIKHINSKTDDYNIAAIAKQDDTPKGLHKETKCDVFICSIEQLNEKIVEECNELGIYLGVYSADDKAQLEKILKFGINAIVTNYPERISKLLAARDNS